MTAINSNRAIRGPVTAVPVVAGKGVRLVADTKNNRVVAEADETVLYDSNGATNISSCTFSESYKNFERMRLITINDDGITACTEIFTSAQSAGLITATTSTLTTEPSVYTKLTTYNLTDTTLSHKQSISYGVHNNYISVYNTTTNVNTIIRVVGINRVSASA